MVDDTGSTGNPSRTVLDSIRSVDSLKTKEVEKRDDLVEQDEFLQILVTQLQNQDPLNPMSNDQFAVDLAQFSQLEQLINLNEKFDTSAGGDVSSMAQYLGRQVAMDLEAIELSNSGESLLQLNLPASGDAYVDLLNAEGSIVETVSLGQLESGRQVVNIAEKTELIGEYGYRARVNAAGQANAAVEAYVLGDVTGFIPGPQGTLLIGDREVALSQIKQVS